MFCTKCGKENPQGASYCVSCGYAFAASVSHVARIENPVTFGRAISICMGKYFDFSGRAARPEYWWFFLFALILSVTMGILDRSGDLEALASLVLFLPSIAVASRRLHDVGRSGWWQLIALTIVGMIPLVIWLASKGESKENHYGSPV